MVSPPFESGTLPRAIEWTDRFVQPPSQLYVDRDDKLLVISWGSKRSQPITIKGRVLTAKGEVQTLHFDHTPPIDRTAELQVYELAEGFLLGLCVTAAAPINYGDVFVEVGLLRGGLAEFERTHPLISGYVANNYSPSWPQGRRATSLEGRSILYCYTGTAPFANEMIVEEVPVNTRWRISAMHFQLSTSDVVGNRRVYIDLDSGDAGVTYWYNHCRTVHSADRVRNYWIAHHGNDPAEILGQFQLNIPPDLYLPSGHRIRAYCTGIQLGDQFRAPHILMEEWFDS